MTRSQYASGMLLIQVQMGVRILVCFFALILLPFTSASADSDSISAQELPLNNLIRSGQINEDMAKLLWTNCKLELVHVKEDHESYSIEQDFSRSNEISLRGRLAKADIQKAFRVSNPEVKLSLLDCFRKMNWMSLESGEENSSTNWYKKYVYSFFPKSDAHKRRKLAQNSVQAPASAPSPAVASPSSSLAPSVSDNHNSQRPTSPPSPSFFPTDLSSPSSQLAAGEPSPNSSSNEQSNKQNKNRKTVLIAVVVTATVTFFIVALLFICYFKVCGVRIGGGQNDERPLLRVSLSNYSIDSPEKSFALNNSLNKETLNKERLGNQSFHTSSNHYVESGVLGTAKLGTVTSAMSTDDDFARKQPPLKPPPGRVVPSELPSSKHSVGSVDPYELPPPSKGALPPPPGKGASPPPPPPGKGAPPPPPPPGKGTPPTTVLPLKSSPVSRPSHPAPPPPPPPIPSSIKTGPAPPPPPVSGVPPPRPPTMGGLKPPRPSSQGLSHPSTSASAEGIESDVPKAKLKPFFWDKVLANPDHSMVWHQIKSGSFQFDEEMIESLFGAPAGKNKKEAKKSSSSSDPSIAYVQIIDPKKSQNLSILLKALNVTTEEVCDALQEGNELPSELLETLLKMAPTAEEELKLRVYNGELSRLGPAERFLKVLIEIPFAFKRIESLIFMCTLQEEASTIKESFATLEAACTELKKSRLFLKLLEAVLKTGNRMNDGTFRGGAQAFKLDTLLKLSDVKGADGKTTLLHFVVQEIIRSEGVRAARAAGESQSMHKINSDDLNGPDDDLENHYRSLGLQVVSGLGDELENVKKAAGLDADSLTATVSKLGRGLVKAKDFLNSDMKNIDEKNRFHQVLRSFVQNAEVDVMWLLEEERRIIALVKSTAGYFHGNTGKDEGLRLFVIVRDFLLILDKSCKEVKDAQRRANKTPKKEDSQVAAPSEPRQVPSDPRGRLFPAIRDRRINSSSSDEDSS